MTRMSAAGKARGLRDEEAPTRFSIERTVIGKLRAWKLEEAKARFSEVVRRAREQGPQRVTYHGKDAVVVIAVDDLKRLLPAERPRRSIVDFLQETALGEIDVRREPDRGRDVAV
jgi:antitoxin Phd